MYFLDYYLSNRIVMLPNLFDVLLSSRKLLL